MRSRAAMESLLLLILTASVASVASAAPAARRVRPAVAARAAARPARHPDAPAGLPRTLSDVHIEGEIPVPQVWFITARDQRRFMDFQHHRYLVTSKELGESTPLPTWVAVIHGSPEAPRKEAAR